MLSWICLTKYLQIDSKMKIFLIFHYQTKTNLYGHRYIKRKSASPGLIFCGHLRDFHRLGGQQTVSARSLRSAKSQQNAGPQQNDQSCRQAKQAQPILIIIF